MKKEKIIEIVLALVLIAIALSVYFGFFYFPSCEDSQCFSDSLIACKKAVYISDSQNTLMKYKIITPEGNNCKVNVRLYQVKVGAMNLANLEGLEMNCYLPLGTLMVPESDLQNCNGQLKEEIQTIVINKLHSEIVQNLGQIDSSRNLTKVL